MIASVRPGKVLLVAQVLVGGDEHIESSLYSNEQCTVDRARKPLLLNCCDGMTGEYPVKQPRQVLVEDDLHGKHPSLNGETPPRDRAARTGTC